MVQNVSDSNQSRFESFGEPGRATVYRVFQSEKERSWNFIGIVLIYETPIFLKKRKFILLKSNFCNQTWQWFVFVNEGFDSKKTSTNGGCSIAMLQIQAATTFPNNHRGSRTLAIGQGFTAPFALLHIGSHLPDKGATAGVQTGGIGWNLRSFLWFNFSRHEMGSFPLVSQVYGWIFFYGSFLWFSMVVEGLIGLSRLLRIRKSYVPQ